MNSNKKGTSWTQEVPFLLRYVLIYAGDGNDTIRVYSKDNTIQAGAGNDVVELVAGTNPTGRAYAAADAVVDLGAGDDSIIAYTGTTAKVTLGAGKDTVNLGGGSDVTLTDYVFGTDVITGLGKVSDMDSFLTSLGSGEVFDTSGTVAIAETETLTTKLTVGKTNGFYAVESTTVEDDGSKTKQAFAWATDDGGTIDLSSYTKGGVVITSANNGTTEDDIIGSSKNDSILAGAYDSVYGGKGDDLIYVDDHAGVTIAVYNDNSTDSVVSANFVERDDGDYDDDDNTKLFFNGNLANAKFSYDDATSTLTVMNGKSKVYLSNQRDVNTAHVDGSTSYDTNPAVGVKVTDGSNSYNVEAVSSVGGALFKNATAVYGNRSKITLSDDFGDAVVDLGSTGKFGDMRYYNGITAVDASTDAGDVVLVGSANASNSLTGGTGNTSLYGGGSKADSLKGGTGADTFFYGKGDGHDTVAGFDAEKDALYFTSDGLTKLTRSEESVKFTFGTDSRNVLEVETSGGADDAISYVASGQSYKAKIGVSTSANTFTYDSSVNYYQGGSKSDTLTASGDTANIWLDGSTGTIYSSIENVDVSGVTGNVTLVGGTASEQLTAGSGEATLWGGLGGNDTLTGSNAAANTFFFGKNNGSDVITATNEGDRVMLYDVAFSDVKSTTTTSDGSFVVTLNDGSKLTIQNYSDNISYTLTDGTYTYSKSNGWQA